MKTPTLIRAIDQGLSDGHAAVVQIVSTGEALLSRRLADIDPGEWNDVQIDITPREYVLDYLLHSFPTQLHEAFTDGDGNLASRPAYDEDGNVVQCREAVERNQPPRNIVGAFMRQEIAEQMSATARNSAPPALRVGAKGFALKWIDLVADETGNHLGLSLVENTDDSALLHRNGSANIEPCFKAHHGQ